MMQPILYVFAFRSTDLLTATIDRLQRHKS